MLPVLGLPVNIYEGLSWQPVFNGTIANVTNHCRNRHIAASRHAPHLDEFIVRHLSSGRRIAGIEN